MNNSLRKWIRGAIELLIYGIASALATGFASYKSDMSWHDWWISNITVFMTTGGLRFVQYFVTHPIPTDDDTQGVNKAGQIVIGTPQVSLNPLAQVQAANPVVK